MKKIIVISCLIQTIFNYCHAAKSKQCQTPPPGLRDELLEAIEKDNIDKAMTLIENGADVNQPIIYENLTGETPLMLAAKNCNVKLMRKLINFGADVNAIAWKNQNHIGNPVLRYAIDSKCHPGVKLLLENGANPNVFVEGGLSKMLENTTVPAAANNPILSYAISIKSPVRIIKSLVRGGANVNQKSQVISWTPLMVAAYMGNERALRWLIHTCANLKAKNKEDLDRIALDYAKMQHHPRINKILQTKMNLPREID